MYELKKEAKGRKGAMTHMGGAPIGAGDMTPSLRGKGTGGMIWG